MRLGHGAQRAARGLPAQEISTDQPTLEAAPINEINLSTIKGLSLLQYSALPKKKPSSARLSAKSLGDMFAARSPQQRGDSKNSKQSKSGQAAVLAPGGGPACAFGVGDPAGRGSGSGATSRCPRARSAASTKWRSKWKGHLQDVYGALVLKAMLIGTLEWSKSSLMRLQLCKERDAHRCGQAAVRARGSAARFSIVCATLALFDDFDLDEAKISFGFCLAAKWSRQAMEMVFRRCIRDARALCRDRRRAQKPGEAHMATTNERGFDWLKSTWSTAMGLNLRMKRNGD